MVVNSMHITFYDYRTSIKAGREGCELLFDTNSGPKRTNLNFQTSLVWN
jgi:hypothetical protein